MFLWTKGYEKALGAALGDDLDAPVDASSPMHWSAISAAARSRPARRRRAARGVTSRLRRNLRGGSRKSAWSSAKPARGWPRRSRPASDWCRATATCGAGMVLSPRPTRRPARRGGWRNAAALPKSTANLRSAAPRSRQAPGRWKRRRPHFDAASTSETETRTRERDLNRQAARLSALAEARTPPRR